jgi:hypothetical protein
MLISLLRYTEAITDSQHSVRSLLPFVFSG